MADIEQHVAELRGKLARFAAFRSLLLAYRSEDLDEDVPERMHQYQSFEDTAAMALAREMAYHEAFSNSRQQQIWALDR